MSTRAPRVLQVSLTDLGGGAERVAFNLMGAYRARGWDSHLAVDGRKTDDPGVLEIPQLAERGAWYRFWWHMRERLGLWDERLHQGWRLRYAAAAMADPIAFWEERRGRESFRFPATAGLLELTRDRPDILHAHNLHGHFFDLRALPRLSQEVPVVLTLHDAWMLSGHCAHSFGCERWQTGCGNCPDLSIPPVVRRDATAENWRAKAGIYAGSRLYVSTPCRWLMDKVERSMLWPAVADSRVVPYGVDLETFRPAARAEARAALGLPEDARVLLFAANGIRENPWKDYRMLREVVERLGADTGGRELIFLALGQDGPAERVGGAVVRFVAFERDLRVVARHYQAADVYLHAARADTFPNTVLEALACGTPVVATAVGGIPEQVRCGAVITGADPGQRAHGLGESTGVLVPAGDAAGMAAAVDALLADGALRVRMSANAAADARARFSLERQASDYLSWYREILAEWESRAAVDPC